MADEITAQLEALVANPREDLHIEIKSWLNLTDKADASKLARAVIALANHGGGFLILGLTEKSDGSFVASDGTPDDLSGYVQDVVARVVTSYSEPTFQVHVHHVDSPFGRLPVVRVPGGHRVPIQAKKGSPDQKTLIVGKVYVRLPTPESAEPRTAAEWRELFDRCIRAGRDDLLDAIRGILSGGVAPEPPAPTEEAKLRVFAEDGLARWRAKAVRTPTGTPIFPPGFYEVAYRLAPEPTPLAPNELMRRLDAATVKHTGWSPWWVPTRDGIAPNWVDDALECFLGENSVHQDPAHSDFWRVTPTGEALIVKGFDEDSVPTRAEPGKVFDVTLPVWRIGECLLQAAAFAERLELPDAEIAFMTTWSGLAGRELVHIEGRRFMLPGRIARQDQLTRFMSVKASKVSDQLPEILHGFLSPLYALFSLFELPASLVTEEVMRLRSNRF